MDILQQTHVTQSIHCQDSSKAKLFQVQFSGSVGNKWQPNILVLIKGYKRQQG